MFGWSAPLMILAFVGSCLAVQCGAFRFFGLRTLALWLIAACFVFLSVAMLLALSGEAGSAIVRIFNCRRFMRAAFILSAAVVAAGAALPFAYAPPGEPILGGADQGIYIASAIHLARTGSYRIEAPILRLTPSALQPWMLGHEPAEAQRRTGVAPRFWNYHIGFFLDPQPRDDPPDPAEPISSKATINPQFPPGFPLLLAAAYETGGWNALSIFNRLCMILAAALLGLIANRWLPVSGVIGLCVFFVGLLQPLNLWIGRSFFAEPSTLCFWLLAILTWQRRRILGETFAGLLAGAFLAGALYLKFDLLFAAALTGLAVLFTAGRRFKIAFGIASAVVGLGALLAWREFSWPNFYGNLTALGQSRALWFLAVGGLLAVGWTWWRSRRATGELRFRFYYPIILAAVILLLAAYAYWIRPNPGEANADRFFYWPIDGLLRSYREETFFRLGWYWQPLGLGAAVLGVALLGFRLRHAWQKAFFWVGLIALVVLCYDLRNNPLQPYAMRRLVPAAMPLLVLGATAFLPVVSQTLFRQRWRNKGNKIRQTIAAAAALAGSVALVTCFTAINSQVNRQPSRGDFGGSVAQISDLAANVPAHSIILVRRNVPLASLATPLQLVQGIDTILIDPSSHSSAYEAAFARAWQDWTRHGYRIFLLSGIEQDRLDLFGANLVIQAHGTIRFPIISPSPVKLSTDVIQIEWDYFLEEIQLRQSDHK